jgi:hypothetical protein
MDDSNRQNNTPGTGGGSTGDRPAPPPPPVSQPSQPSGGYSPPPPPPPPLPQPYPANPPSQPYPQNTPQAPQSGPPQAPVYGGASGGYAPPTESYPVQGQVPPGRHDQPTVAYPQGVYGGAPGGPPQGYRPQDAYPPQYGGPVGPPPIVVPPKKGIPAWAIAVPLLLVLAIGGALIAWSVLQSQENDRKVAAASTATAQSQATATSAQAEINRRATGTVVAQKTATAATDAANKRGTSTAAAIAAKTSTAVVKEQLAAAQTATAGAQAAQAAARTATALAILLIPSQTPVATISISPNISGEIQDIKVDYDVTDDSGKKGMRIHVKFIVDNAKDVPCQATAYFYDEATGETVKNTDPNYSSVVGDLVVSSTFKPGFDSTIYDDFILFMPYEQIRLTGEHKLYFVVQAYVISPYKSIVSSARQPFTFTK